MMVDYCELNLRVAQITAAVVYLLENNHTGFGIQYIVIAPVNRVFSISVSKKEQKWLSLCEKESSAHSLSCSRASCSLL